MTTISEVRPADYAETAPRTAVRRKADPIAEEAARWLVALQSDDESVRTGFVTWVRQSPQHFGAFLRISADEFESGANAGVTHRSNPCLNEDPNGDICTVICSNPLRDEPSPVVIGAVRQFGVIGLVACALGAALIRWWTSLVSRCS